MWLKWRSKKGYEDNKLLSQEHKFLFSKKAMKVSFEPNTSVAVMQYLKVRPWDKCAYLPIRTKTLFETHVYSNRLAAILYGVEHLCMHAQTTFIVQTEFGISPLGTSAVAGY